MSKDAENFLSALLFIADDSPSRRHIGNWTIHEFHHEFVEAVEKFLSGFRAYLDKHCGYDPDLCGSSFGCNVYLSLSGSGAGFSAERDSELGDALQSCLEEYSGNRYRFEELDCNLRKFHGKIHMAFNKAKFRRYYLSMYFSSGVKFVTEE